MQGIEHCTRGCTTLYAVRACCTVCNMQAESFCDTMAEWEVFEADLWNVDSHSSVNCFRFRHCVISESSGIASQLQYRQEMLSFRSEITAKLLLQAHDGCIHLLWREEKS